MLRARRLRSSLIERILFDDEAHELSVWFRGRGKYVYAEVPRTIYDAFARAASAGTFFNACVKGRFAARRDPSRRSYPPG